MASIIGHLFKLLVVLFLLFLEGLATLSGKNLEWICGMGGWGWRKGGRKEESVSTIRTQGRRKVASRNRFTDRDERGREERKGEGGGSKKTDKEKGRRMQFPITQPTSGGCENGSSA